MIISDIRKEILELKQTPKELREFGLLVGSILGFLSFWMWFQQKELFVVLLFPSVVLLTTGFIIPRRLKYIYLVWMSGAIIMGYFMSRVVLTLLFFAVITPISILARAVGKQFIQTQWKTSQASYWNYRKPTHPQYEKQF